MNNVPRKKKRLERVAPLELPPSFAARIVGQLSHREAWTRIGLAFCAAVCTMLATGVWYPPFAHRTGVTPQRDVLALYELPNPTLTEEVRREARSQIRFVYENDPQPLEKLRGGLLNVITTQLLPAEEMTPEVEKTWRDFLPSTADPDKAPSREQIAQQFKKFREALKEEQALENYEKVIDQIIRELQQHGLINKLTQEPTEGNQTEIFVHPVGDPTYTNVVKVKQVLHADANAELRKRLMSGIDPPQLAEHTYHWLSSRLPVTLKLDEASTELEAQKAADAVELQTYPVGHVIARGGQPLSAESMNYLRQEYQLLVNQLPPAKLLWRVLAALGMYVAVFTLCAEFIWRQAPNLLADIRQLATFLAIVVVTIVLAVNVATDNWRAELIPLLIFGMSIAIAYQRGLAFLLSVAVTFIVVVTLGQGLRSFVILTSALAVAILSVGSVRNRTKLIFVGLVSGAVTSLTTVGVSLLTGQPWGMELLADASRFGLWAIIAGFLMTGLLPFIETAFGILTDLSLLELGDAAHPLLQELVRRAPGTYNHSINVASLAEAAADSIGARGLLVRVGAYFHDIGKMLKPGYFVENQGRDANRHDALVPAMSTLIIVAHVKDGADLARQHHLPQAIIDFIQQHHGTTLVEYFYRRANERCEQDPDAAEVNESSFRYPGPKPQTKEAAVLMLSDAVESASRVLVDPTSARIEGLVNDLAMKRLLDGQFDECDLTLSELRTVSDSLIKSLIAVYHGRVKYPGEQQLTA